MSLADLTPESVHQAIAEFDRLGRDSFLSTYGFGKARGYLLIHNGHAYDSKAIAGVAHQYLEIEQAAGKLRGLSLEELRRQAIEDAVDNPERREGRRSYVGRSASVRAYVLKRADGICESCEKPAPFRRSNGDPYLEPHHTRRLADGGPDHPRWVGAVCPTCHREIHHGENGRKRNDELKKKLADIENGLEASR